MSAGTAASAFGPISRNASAACRLSSSSRSLSISVSALERFAACPYKFFVEYGLGVKERKEFLLDVREQLIFQNEVLEKFHRELKAGGLKWRVLTPEEASERADKSGNVDRRLSVLIVIAIDAEKADDVDDELDGWAELVEQALKQMPLGAAKRFTLTATSLDLPAVEEGETWVGYLAMEYEAEIFG